jgi:hypothetical protein
MNSTFDTRPLMMMHLRMHEQVQAMHPESNEQVRLFGWLRLISLSRNTIQSTSRTLYFLPAEEPIKLKPTATRARGTEEAGVPGFCILAPSALARDACFCLGHLKLEAVVL